MWWKGLGKPISGVANCHVKGVYSLMFDANVRAFITNDWTPLAGNFFGEAVGFHDHHRALDIKVIVGQILNIAPRMNRGEYHPLNFNAWAWDSRLRGGKGAFHPLDSDSFISHAFVCRTLDRNSSPLHMRQQDVHTIKQLSKMSLWLVRESGNSVNKWTKTWSTLDLSHWHEQQQSDMYQPMTSTSVAALWESMQGLT